MAFSFFGGIHPKENKKYACDKPVQDFPEPDVLVIPMVQHIGAPCKPLVKKGDLVTTGQKIGDNQGLCAPVHAPVSGKVKAVEPRPHTSGTMVMSVVIENDHMDTLCEEIKPRTSGEVDRLTGEELMGIIREAGIVGMGGAAFPTHVKLSSGLNKVDTVIVNVSECEPFIVADDRLCQEYAPEVISGLKIVMRILGLRSAHIAMEDNKPAAAKAIKRALDPKEGIVLDILPAKYPQGAEKQLIYAVTGREIPSGGLPAAVGCAVVNAATCKAIHDAVYLGMPLIRRIVTVSGDICMEPKNLMVPLGVSFNELMEAVGTSENPYKVLSGGPMMGAAQWDLEGCVTKGTSAVLFFSEDFVRPTLHHSACIHCGRCVDHCPMHLMPYELTDLARKRQHDEAMKKNIMSCVECGTCSYGCPAGVEIVQYIRAAKGAIRQQMAADRARQAKGGTK